MIANTCVTQQFKNTSTVTVQSAAAKISISSKCHGVMELQWHFFKLLYILFDVSHLTLV